MGGGASVSRETGQREAKSRHTLADLLIYYLAGDSNINISRDRLWRELGGVFLTKDRIAVGNRNVEMAPASSLGRC